jgi:kynurenine--oxoglutarate transaminase/cysteine-S-conjugate beta-lyase/glutamine--phenylpyruvate transaminase
LPTSSVWDTFTPLANAHASVNLGQGFPTFAPPHIVVRATQAALERGVTQYTRAQGHVRLVHALARYVQPTLSAPIDPMRNIVATVGATEALLLATMATLNPGDGALLIAPFYDSYAEQVRLAGGVPHFCSLRRGDSDASSWTLPFDELEAAASANPSIKLLFFNNPSNVPGKVYSRAELERVAAFAVKHNLTVIADEVYDVLTFESRLPFIRLASLPGMAERTISVGSAGKLFSVTGFKVGWCVGPENLIAAMSRVHQYVAFCVSSTLQEGVAAALEDMAADNYVATMRAEYDARRHLLVDMLRRVNLRPIVPQGSYFVVADASGVDPARFVDPASSDALDWQFCKWLTVTGGVCAIPLSPFYNRGAELPGVLARFAFCKTNEQIAEAEKRLQKLLK